MKHSIKQNGVIVFMALLIFTMSCQSVFNQTINTPKDSITATITSQENRTRSNINVSESNSTFNLKNDTKENIAYAFFAIMLVLIVLFFIHLRYKKQYIGFQSIKLIGLILLVPGICVLTIMGEGKLISESTLAALLGTIAGYVLSRENNDDSDKDTVQLTKTNEILEKENKTLLAKIKHFESNDLTNLKNNN